MINLKTKEVLDKHQDEAILKKRLSVLNVGAELKYVWWPLKGRTICFGNPLGINFNTIKRNIKMNMTAIIKRNKKK